MIHNNVYSRLTRCEFEIEIFIYEESEKSHCWVVCMARLLVGKEDLRKTCLPSEKSTFLVSTWHTTEDFLFRNSFVIRLNSSDI